MSLGKKKVMSHHSSSHDPELFYEDVARLYLSPLWLRQGHSPHRPAVPYLRRWPVVAGARFDWTERDVFVVPGRHWHEHSNASSSDAAILISYTDEPLLKAVGIHREEPEQAGPVSF